VYQEDLALNFSNSLTYPKDQLCPSIAGKIRGPSPDQVIGRLHRDSPNEVTLTSSKALPHHEETSPDDLGNLRSLILR